MKREIEVTGKTIYLLAHCLYESLRNPTDPDELEDYVEARDFIGTLKALHAEGWELEENSIILTVKE
jgi:hypothetical protein